MLSINLASKISNKDKTAVNAKQIFFDPDYIEKNLNAVLLGSARYLIDHSDEIDKIQIIKNFEEYKKFRCYIINQSDTNNTKFIVLYTTVEQKPRNKIITLFNTSDSKSMDLQNNYIQKEFRSDMPIVSIKYLNKYFWTLRKLFLSEDIRESIAFNNFMIMRSPINLKGTKLLLDIFINNKKGD